MIEEHLCAKCLSETCSNVGYDTSIAKCTAYIPPKPITNYDRIINKAPEELADFLYATWKQQDTFSKDVCEKCPDTSCQPKCWLNWLREECNT